MAGTKENVEETAKSTDIQDSKQEEKQETLSPEVESEIDRRVTEAINTRDKKHKEELEILAKKSEKEQLEKDGKYEELTKRYKEDIEEHERKIVATQFKTELFSELKKEELLHYADFVDHYSDIETAISKAKELATMNSKIVDAEVNTRLGTGQHATAGKPKTLKRPQDMTHEEWAEYKKGKGLH